MLRVLIENFIVIKYGFSENNASSTAETIMNSGVSELLLLLCCSHKHSFILFFQPSGFWDKSVYCFPLQNKVDIYCSSQNCEGCIFALTKIRSLYD